MCSGWTSLPSAGQYIFCLSGTLSWSCRVRKCSRFSRIAVKRRTGMVTSPKLIEPDQMGREEPFSIVSLASWSTEPTGGGAARLSHESGSPAALPRVLNRLLLDHLARGFIPAQSFEGRLLDHSPLRPA